MPHSGSVSDLWSGSFYALPLIARGSLLRLRLAAWLIAGLTVDIGVASDAALGLPNCTAA